MEISEIAGQYLCHPYCTHGEGVLTEGRKAGEGVYNRRGAGEGGAREAGGRLKPREGQGRFYNHRRGKQVAD